MDLRKWTKESVTDVISLALGAFLFLSPWLLGYAAEAAASWNAWISGVVIAGVAVGALAAFAEWEEWMSLVAGVWVAVSPWIVGFSAHGTATNVQLAIGAIVAIAAAVRLWLMHRTPPRVTA